MGSLQKLLSSLTNNKQPMSSYFRLLLLLVIVFLLGAFTSRQLEKKITRTDIQAAAKVIGLEMTNAEIDSLLPNVQESLELYEQNRSVPIDNSVAPALVFSPLPPHYSPPTEQEPLVLGEIEKVSLPENREELAWYTVRELGELLRTRQITSFELTEFFLERLERFDDTLHCVVTLTEALALEQARQADLDIAAGTYRGPLHGIPYGAKDLLATRGYKTTWGAMPFKDQRLEYDATVIEKLEAAGAVLCAKLTLGALAWGDVWYGGTTRNPWGPETGSSGSSAGSASAVAAGLLPFALGTETLGSIVSPSTVCGVTGLRPTFGRVSRHGAMALSWSMDKIGPITRSAEDCALVLDAIYGADGKDLACIDAPFNYNARLPLSELTIGYDAEAFERDYGFKAQDSLSLEVLRSLGAQLVPIKLPDYPGLDIILSAEAAAAFDDLTRSNRDDELVRQIRNAWPNTFRQARFIPAVEYLQANRLRTQLIGEMDALFQDVDLYVHPSWSSSSFRITNHTGHPCITVPNGFRENGRPTSITFTGRLFEEGRLIRIAQAFQEATEWEEQHPEMF